VIYVDETGIDSYLYRERARALKGLKIKGFISGKRYKRTGIVAGKCGKKIIAPLQYDGTMDSKLFEFWMKNMLLKDAKKGSVIVMDNAAFHRKKELETLAKQASCEILFLPPYSPDLNPIEYFWSWLKQKLREILHKYKSLDDAIMYCFEN
jgi:transposase